MGLLDFSSLEWTPAACFLAFQATLLVLTSLAFISGQTGAFYNAEPHTKKISMGRTWEICWGGHLLFWGACMIAALISGGAQNMCILMLPGMLACTYYHYAAVKEGEASGKTSVVANTVFMVAEAYFGFVPMPTTPSIEFTPAVIFLTFQATLCLLVGLMMFMGPPDAFYKSSPHLKDIMSRQGERGLGGMLIGIGCGIVGAVIAGGAQNMCVLELPGLAVCIYAHYLGKGMKDVITNSIFMMIIAYFGFARYL